MPKLAIFGFTPREEVIVNTLRRDTRVEIGLFSGIANRALEERVDHVHGTEDEDLRFLREWDANVVLIGPDKFSSNGTCERLNRIGISAIGSDSEQIKVETDRGYLRNNFPELAKFYPPYQIFKKYNREIISECLRSYKEYVVKYNGVYAQLGGGSKLSGLHLNSIEDAMTFAKESITESGSVVIEKQVKGRDFSLNALTAGDGSIYFFPENHCYKLRNTGDTGQNTSGTGSVAFAGRLPFMTSNQQTVARDICRELVAKINYSGHRPLVSGLNLDFRVGDDGKIYLFEMNMRFAGAGTLSTAFDLCGDELFGLLSQAKTGSFDGIAMEAREAAAVSVFTFPKFFPNEPSQDVEATIHKASAVPAGINCYTGWVDVVKEHSSYREVMLRNSTTQLFEASGKSVSECREKIYKWLEGTPDVLEYRTDIGQIAGADIR